MAYLERIHPAKFEWPEAGDDLNTMPRDARRIRLVSKAIGFDKLREFEQLETLWCFGIDQKKLAQIVECKSIRELHLDYNLRFDDFTPLKKLRSLEVLTLNSCSKVTSLEQLSDLDQLKGFAIENFKNVHDIKPLSRLTRLKELGVDGSIWTRMTIDSLSPIADLHELEFLSLSNTKVRDESLDPLARLHNLKTLHAANFFPFEEFAKLSGALPGCECNWFVPYLNVPLNECAKCHVHKVMLTGKSKKLLCPRCDATRLASHVADFERIKNEVEGKRLGVDHS